MQKIPLAEWARKYGHDYKKAKDAARKGSLKAHVEKIPVERYRLMIEGNYKWE